MRIAVIAIDGPPDTGGINLSRCAAHWVEWGHDVAVLPDGSEVLLADQQHNNGRFGAPSATAALVAAVVAGLALPRPEVIFTTSPLAGWLLGWRHLRLFVVLLGETTTPSGWAVGERLRAFLYRRSAAVATSDTAVKSELVRRGVSAGRIVVVPSDAALSAPRPEPAPGTSAAHRRQAEQMLQVLEIAAAGYGDRVGSEADGAGTVA